MFLFVVVYDVCASFRPFIYFSLSLYLSNSWRPFRGVPRLGSVKGRFDKFIKKLDWCRDSECRWEGRLFQTERQTSENVLFSLVTVWACGLVVSVLDLWLRSSGQKHASRLLVHVWQSATVEGYWVHTYILNIHVSCRWEPLAGSTCLRGSSTGGSFSLLCLVLLID